jgi:tetratricopeptide (TPR) repeat protein
MIRVIFLVTSITLSIVASRSFSSEHVLPTGLHKAWERALAQDNLTFNTKALVNRILDGDVLNPIHNWETLANEMPKPLTDLAEATFISLSINSGLHQTAFDRLMINMAKPSFRKSAAWLDLAREIEPTLPQWLYSHAIVISKHHESALSSWPWTGIQGIIRSYASMNEISLAPKALTHTSPAWPWYDRILLLTGLTLARSGNIREATQILKKAHDDTHLTPDQKAEIALALGRLYYQDADFKNAEQWYLKTTHSKQSSLMAEEELMWVWLHTGNSTRLRGSSEFFKRRYSADVFAPEVPLIRTISDVKLCQFSQAKQSFANFLSTNLAWAKKIDQALSAEQPPKPPMPDPLTLFNQRALQSREEEAKAAHDIASSSRAASVPAIGKQQHWTSITSNLKRLVGQLASQQTANYRRQWRNQRVMLQEAIKKMEFVKLELASQAHAGTKANPDSESSKKALESADAAIDDAGRTAWTFPLDNDQWIDERIVAQSNSASVCL